MLSRPRGECVHHRFDLGVSPSAVSGPVLCSRDCYMIQSHEVCFDRLSDSRLKLLNDGHNRVAVHNDGGKRLCAVDNR
jgi:hypothetical protein